MTREAINPAGLRDTSAIYSQAIRTRGRTTIHCAGQVAVDRDGVIHGQGDIVAQCRQTLANLKLLLVEAGATPADVASTRIYVVDHKPEYLRTVMPEIVRFFGGAALPASTWIGVAALARPEILIEIEATAVIDD